MTLWDGPGSGWNDSGERSAHAALGRLISQKTWINSLLIVIIVYFFLSFFMFPASQTPFSHTPPMVMAWKIHPCSRSGAELISHPHPPPHPPAPPSSCWWSQKAMTAKPERQLKSVDGGDLHEKLMSLHLTWDAQCSVYNIPHQDSYRPLISVYDCASCGMQWCTEVYLLNETKFKR